MTGTAGRTDPTGMTDPAGSPNEPRQAGPAAQGAEGGGPAAARLAMATAPGPDAAHAAAAPQRATARFMWRHPAHWVALGFGSGLSPRAPGTVGTLWAWASFLVLDPWLSDAAWGLVLGAGLLVGWWACTRCAQHLGTADPGAIVWDEVLAFWAVLWLVMPAGWLAQLVAFGLFRLFDAAKPGPVRWADQWFKTGPRAGAIGWWQGLGILVDDLVAALCTLMILALWRAGT